IDLGREKIGADDRLDELTYRLDMQGEFDADDKAEEGADEADAGTSENEDAQDRAPRRTHGAEDRDVAPLILHHHDHAGDDVERRDEDDQRQDQEHDVALDLDGVEEAEIALLP